MSVTPAPTHAVVKYQSPSERAYSAAGKTALGLVIALLIPLVSLGVKYLVTGDFSHTAFVALLTAAGVAAGGVLLQFLLKLQSAISDNIPPTVAADGTVTPPEPAPAASAVFAPPITAETLRGLLETVDVLQQWRGPEPPPATISHRIVTPAPPITGGGMPGINVSSPPIAPLATDAAVKRSHHAAKAPAIDVATDS
jgi:hypothetical protein